MFKKVFAAMLAGLFISAPAFAEVKMSGSFFIKGNSMQSASKKVDSYNYYESDLEIKTQIIVDESTAIDVVAEAFDTNWYDQAFVDSNAHEPGVGQNYFEISKATMTHKFATGTTFNGGIAGNSNSWGTLFGDDLDRIYFLQADQALPFGTLTILTEKYSEGLVSEKDADGNDVRLKSAGIYDDSLDADGYLIGLSMDVAGFNVMPAVHYKKDKAIDEETTKLMVAATGNIGNITIESEFGFADYSNDRDGDAAKAAEGNVFGAWVDASTNVAGLTLNTGFLYASADDAVSYIVGDELCPMEILGDEVLIDGTTLFRVKVAKAITEKVGVDFSAAYAFTNVDKGDRDPSWVATEDNVIEGSDVFDNAYELDANASFKASDAVTLSCGVAYLDGDYNKVGTDGIDEVSFPQARIDAYAKINVAF